MASIKTCPSCGANEPWVDSHTPTRNKCKHCGTEYNDGAALGEKERVFIEIEPETGLVEVDPETREPLPQKKASVWEYLALILVISLFCSLMLWMTSSLTKETRQASTVNTIGQYEVLPLECPDGSQGIAVEYGFTNKEPFLKVFPGVEGSDRWSITAEQADQIALEHSNSYLWVHCVNSENLPEYYSQGTLSAKPQDGMQVVYKRK